MPEALNMPQVGQDLTHGKLIDWHVDEGATIAIGDVVAEVESEKATFEVEATAAGILLKKLYAAGEDAEVFKPIAWIGKAGEAIPGAGGSQAPRSPAAAETDLSDEDVQTRRASLPSTPCRGRILASPAARRVARERGVELSGLTGTGPNGRIVKRDVPAAAVTAPRPAPGAPQPSGADEVIRFDRIRQIIADRLLASRQQIPDFDISLDIDMTPAMAWRSAYNQTAPAKITVNDLVVHAVARCLRRFPRLNSHVSQQQMVIKKRIDLGIAVAVADGLLVPVLRDADCLSLDDTAGALKKLAADARRGVVSGSGSSFSISNLGSSGVSRFTPIINPPECAILGVAAIEDRVIAHEGMFGVRKLMTLTLVCDHRAVDGAYAADFLRAVKEHLTGCGF